jgi:DNA mismatch repair protein MutS2
VASSAGAGRPARRGGGTSLPEGAAPEPLSEVDLRGLTAEEAIEALDRHLDGAILAGYPSVRIIHGKGTGVLRTRVKNYLEKHAQVTSFELGQWNEGGAGVTVAKLG